MNEYIFLIIFVPFFLFGLWAIDEYFNRKGKPPAEDYPEYARKDKNKPSTK